MLLQSVDENADEQNDTETEDDPRIFQEDLERIKPSKQRSNHRLLWLAIVTCLILMVSLLVGLLIMSEKINRRCGCSEQNGVRHHKNPPTGKDFLRENETSISDSLEYLSSTMVKVEAAVDESKNDIAKLNRMTTTVENLNSAMKELEVKAALDGTKRDLANLKETVTTLEYLSSTMVKVEAAVDESKNDIAKLNRMTTTVENLNSAMKELEVKAALDGTKRDLANLKETVTTVKCASDRTSNELAVLNCTMTKLNKANQSNLRMSCQNETWNAGHDECKHESRSATNFSGKSSKETPPAAKSCKELYNRNGSDGNKEYPLKLGKRIHPVYCHMTALNGCGGGGWTLVMKMDCSKNTFHYNQLIWSNKLKTTLFLG
ncbi:fibrinogen- and Ig-binding protein [Pocillopora verrucosa]|uniref:fibrinogen- and Ig-binding protein n=1 Tax=Pocillopora verrucosa TaxID=203993 RepID=UPI0033409134